jgi:hypothetical protein
MTTQPISRGSTTARGEAALSFAEAGSGPPGGAGGLAKRGRADGMIPEVG